MARICRKMATATTTIATTMTMETTTTSPDTAGTIELQYHAANNATGGGGDNNDEDGEGMPRKTLVTATIRKDGILKYRL
jgi:hypothetical protein